MYSRTELLGRLGADPEVKVANSGKKWAKFSIATERYAGKDSSTGQAKKQTIWHNCTAFDQNAEYLEKYGRVGQRAFVVGEYVYEEGTGENEGKRFYKVIVSMVKLLDRAEDAEGAAPAKAASATSTAGSTTTQDEDIPF